VWIAAIGSVAAILGVKFVTDNAMPAQPARFINTLDWKELPMSPQVEKAYELLLEEAWLQGSERFIGNSSQLLSGKPNFY
jgi:hypothetical protein